MEQKAAAGCALALTLIGSAAHAAYPSASVSTITGYSGTGTDSASMVHSFMATGSGEILSCLGTTNSNCNWVLRSPANATLREQFQYTSAGTTTTASGILHDQAGDWEFTGAGYGIFDNGLQDKALLSDCVVGTDSAGHFTATVLGTGLTCSAGTLTAPAPASPTLTSCVSTATVTPGTLGDWSPTYGTQSCSYIKTPLSAGTLTEIYETVTFTTNAFTTAAGNLHFNLPSTGANFTGNQALFISSPTSAITWPTGAVYIQMALQSNTSYALIQSAKSGSGFTGFAVGTGNQFLPSTTYTVTFNGRYFSQ